MSVILTPLNVNFANALPFVHAQKPRLADMFFNYAFLGKRDPLDRYSLGSVKTTPKGNHLDLGSTLKHGVIHFNGMNQTQAFVSGLNFAPIEIIDEKRGGVQFVLVPYSGNSPLLYHSLEDDFPLMVRDIKVNGSRTFHPNTTSSFSPIGRGRDCRIHNSSDCFIIDRPILQPAEEFPVDDSTTEDNDFVEIDDVPVNVPVDDSFDIKSLIGERVESSSVIIENSKNVFVIGSENIVIKNCSNLIIVGSKGLNLNGVSETLYIENQVDYDFIAGLDGLYDIYGFEISLTTEEALANKLGVDKNGMQKLFERVMKERPNELMQHVTKSGKLELPVGDLIAILKGKSPKL